MRDARLLLVLRCAACAGFSIAIITAASHVRHVNHTTVALVLVLTIVETSIRWGWMEALIASLVGGLGFDYFFLQPRGFNLEAPEYAITLAAFLLTAITAGQLSARAGRHRREAERRRDEMAGLYRLGNALLHVDSATAAPAEIAQQVLHIYPAREVAYFDRQSGAISRAGDEQSFLREEKLRQVAATGIPWLDHDSVVYIAPVLRGASLAGSIGILGVPLSRTALEAIAERVGVALERVRYVQESMAAELARRAETLKSAVLDALAHEIKGPLATIEVSISTLLSDRPGDAIQQHELLTIISEESERMAHWIDRAIQVSRCEAAVIRLNKQPNSIRQVAARALEGLGPREGGRPIEVSIPDSLPSMPFDAEMIEKVIRLLLDNALKYSPPDSPVRMSARFTGAEIVLSIEDRGCGVPDYEKERIFERYYRGSNAAAGVPGTGLGLASAKCIMEAHGGEIWVTSLPGSGSVFHISLPAAMDVTDEQLESIERG